MIVHVYVVLYTCLRCKVAMARAVPTAGDGDWCMQDGDACSTTRSAAKAFATKYRGVMMRPMTTAVTKAQADFKPFVDHPEDIDHNLYGKFLGILKGTCYPVCCR